MLPQWGVRNEEEEEKKETLSVRLIEDSIKDVSGHGGNLMSKNQIEKIILKASTRKTE